MLKVALRGIRAHLVRFVMSLLAVALGVAFVAGTFALRTMLSSTFDDVVAAAVQADVYVRGASPEGDSASGSPFGQARPTVPLDLREQLQQIDGVATVLPEVNPSVVLVGADGTAVSAGQAPSFALLYSPQDPAMSVIAGTAPAGPGEIGLEQGALAASGLALGETTSIVLGGEIREVTVTAELDLGGGMAGATIVLLPQEAGLELTAPDGQVADLALYLSDGADPDDVAAAVEAAIGADAGSEVDPATLEVVTGDALRAENKEAIGSALGFVTTFLLVFAAIALFVGAFIIANTFAMSVRQRMREFALLRAVGASPAQVFGSILVQAAVVGLLGSAIGVLGGLGLVEALRVVFESMGMTLSGKVPLEISTVVIALLIGTIVSVAAAAIPARRAALVPPVEAMREEVAATDASLRSRTVAGIALLALGAAAVTVALANPTGSAAQTWLGVGAGAAVIGMLVVAPALARAVIGVLAWPFARLLPPIGRLARGNVTRNPRRTANTAGALMIGMALVGAATVIAATTQASVASVVRQEMSADIVVRSADSNVPAGAIADIAALPEVDSFDVMAFAVGQVAEQGSQAEQAIIVAADRAAFDRSLAVEVIDGDLDTLTRGGAVVNEMAAGTDWEVGDTLTLSASAGQVEVEVGAIVSSNAMGGGFIVAPETLNAIEVAQAQLVDTVFVNAADGEAEALHEAVAAAVAPYIIVSVLTQEQFISSMAAQIDQILVILYALLGLSIVIAVLGIVNTLALSVIERTREIGLLRAVGLGRLQLAGTVTIESVLTAVFGTVVGLTFGVALASTLPTLFSEEGLSELSIPWGSLVGMLVLAVVVGVLAALWPGVRAARLRVLDAVSYE